MVQYGDRVRTPDPQSKESHGGEQSRNPRRGDTSTSCHHTVTIAPGFTWTLLTGSLHRNAVMYGLHGVCRGCQVTGLLYGLTADVGCGLDGAALRLAAEADRPVGPGLTVVWLQAIIAASTRAKRATAH